MPKQITKKEAAAVISVRANEEIKLTGSGKKFGWIMIAGTIAGIVLMVFVSTIVGIVVWGISLIAGIVLAQRNFKKVSKRVGDEFERQWKGFIEE